jgi:hypothetical protein
MSRPRVDLRRFTLVRLFAVIVSPKRSGRRQ